MIVLEGFSLLGNRNKCEFMESMNPDNLYNEMMSYKNKFGESFGISDMLKIKEIESRALIAEAIEDAPEFLFHQLALYRKDGPASIVDAIDAVAEAISGSQLM